jgi:hypothetical protein
LRARNTGKGQLSPRASSIASVIEPYLPRASFGIT